MTTERIRREPPTWCRVSVACVTSRTPYLVRLTLTGSGLDAYATALPGASLRLLVPPPGQHELVLPRWTGNEYRYEDGSRPDLRTLTPVAFRRDRGELDIEVVLHGSGPLSTWAAGVSVGDLTAVSGPGRGYDVDPRAAAFLVAGDESALPAIATVLAALPAAADVHVVVEVGHPDARVELPAHPRLVEQWCDAQDPPGANLVAAVVATSLPDDVRVWAAGEAAAMQRIRQHLFGERHLTRLQCVVRGYWKHGRAGTPDD